MKLTLDIPNHNFEFFLKLIKSLNFDIKIEEENDISIPDWHLDILEERLAKYQTDTSSFVTWDAIKKQVEEQL